MSNQALIQTLRDPITIRKKSALLFDRVKAGESQYFSLDLSKVASCTDYIIQLMKNDYPSLDVPFHSRWRHFEAGNIDRIHQLKQHQHFPNDKKEASRCFFELVIISVLLDAGAGNEWHYHEKNTDILYSRSEGLAIASLDMYQSGLFSSHTHPFSVNMETLSSLTGDSLSYGFQITEDNPLLGLEGRLTLLNRLADISISHPRVFGEDNRLGCFFDFLLETVHSDTIDATVILKKVLKLFSSIWPSRLTLDQENLGDVWQYSALPDDKKQSNLIPFHKLSQWLTYSLLEPFVWYGLKIKGLERLTGLPEYRNGGFFIDMDVIAIKDKALLEDSYPAYHDAIIEWRALTIILLDRLWEAVCSKLSFSKTNFPLVKLLEAGTWKAGRQLAYQKRKNGASPIQLISDGTVF